MKILEPKHTPIVKIVDVGDGWIVLESRFNHPDFTSNLYKVDRDFKEVWVAEDRGCKAKYELLIIESGQLIVYDNYGQALLDPDTGLTSNWRVTK